MTMKAITTKYYTTSSGAGRIMARDEDGNRKSIPYPHEISGIENRHRAAFDALCDKMGWQDREHARCGHLKDGRFVFVFEDFDEKAKREATEKLTGFVLRVSSYCRREIDNDEEINGADAVDMLVELVCYARKLAGLAESVGLTNKE